MAEMQPPEALHLSSGGGGGSDGNVGGGGVSVVPAGVSTQVTSVETVGSKRQRRPSVRLGDIGGEQLFDPYPRKATSNSKSWKQQHQRSQILSVDQKKDWSASNKSRALTNLTTADCAETLGQDLEMKSDRVAIGSWRVDNVKKRAPNSSVKRARASWVTNSGGVGGNNNNVQGEMEDFDAENSDPPSKQQSPVHSVENLGNGSEREEMYYNKRVTRTRSGNHTMSSLHHLHHNQDGIEVLSGPSEMDAKGVLYRGDEMCGVAGEDGVRIWLNNLGLGRYAPVFEIHEVDDQVLPMLTLEDLKDMGINAVGSRRKMFSAIQQLSKGFS